MFKASVDNLGTVQFNYYLDTVYSFTDIHVYKRMFKNKRLLQSRNQLLKKYFLGSKRALW